MFPLLIFIVLLWLDVFTFSGFTSSHFIIPPKILLIISLLSSAYIFLFSSLPLTISKKISYLTLGASTLYLLLITIEGLTTQGYVYGHFYMRPESMFYPVLALVAVAVSTNLVVQGSSAIRFATYLLAVSISFYFLRLLPIVLVQSSTLIKTMAMSPSASYDDKMRAQWGDFYDYMVYLRANLPKEGTVLGIPTQQNPWLLYGNGMLVQSFVYPTTVTGIDFAQDPGDLPPYLMQLSDWPPHDPALGSTKWGLIKL